MSRSSLQLAAWVGASVISLATFGSGPVAAGPLPKLPTTKPVTKPGPMPAPKIDKPVCVSGKTLYVAPGGHGTGSSFKSALPSVTAALAKATEQSHCRADIRVAKGEYHDTGTVTIDRHTKIQGPKGGWARLHISVRNRTASDLELRKLVFDHPEGPAVDVDHDDASTVMASSSVLGAKGFGIKQDGGELTMQGIVINATRNLPAAGTGVGLRLTGGVVAHSTGLTMAKNEGQAIDLAGQHTKLVARTTIINDTGHHSSLDTLDPADGVAVPSIGAVRVSAYATLLADSLKMFRNDFVGVLVVGGGKAHLKRFELRTVNLLREGMGTFAVYIGDRGTTELHDFKIQRECMMGLVIKKGRIKATDGKVIGCDIGAVVDPRQEDTVNDVVRCFNDNVKFIDNGHNLQSSSVPFPTSPLAEEQPPPPSCGVVPWVE